MYSRLVIEDDAIYEIDDECMKNSKCIQRQNTETVQKEMIKEHRNKKIRKAK